MELIIGLIAIYTWVHFTIIFFQKAFNKLSAYEKVVSVTALVTIFLYITSTL